MEAYMVGRTQRVCQVCGKTFYGNDDHFYCLDCARARKSNAVVRIRICQDCKVEFLGGPRAKKCPDCAYAAKLETSKRHKNAGTRRPLGSIALYAEISIQLFLDAKSTVLLHASGKVFWNGRGCISKGMTRYLGSPSKNKSGVSKYKRFVYIVCVHFRAIHQPTYVLITVGQNINSYPSA